MIDKIERDIFIKRFINIVCYLILIFIFCLLLSFYLPISLVFRANRMARAQRFWDRIMIMMGLYELEIASFSAPADQTCIFLLDHRSFWDIITVTCSIPYQFSNDLSKKMSAMPFFGLVVDNYGIVLIDRSIYNGSVSRLKEALDHLKSGLSFNILPDCPRSKIGVFKEGSFSVFSGSLATIVPVSITRSRLTRRSFYSSRLLKISFGELILHKDYHNLPIDDLKNFVPKWIKKLAAQ